MNADYARAQEGQRQAADPEASVFVTANAGSGKTKVLIDRVARLLLAGGAPSSFLCVTYTKAAAAEMQRRLFARLGAWSVADDAALRRELGALMGGDAPLGDAALSRARALFAQALETPGGLRIQTIHAFCERLLKRFPLEAGVPAGFAVADETEAARLLEQAWAHAIAARPAPLAHLAEKLHYEALEELRRALLARGDLAAAHLRDGLVQAEARIAARHGASQDRARFLVRFLEEIPWRDLEAARALLERSGRADQATAALIAAARGAHGEDQREAYFDIFLTKGGDPRANVITRRLRDADAFLDSLFTAEMQRVLAADAALKAIERSDDMRALLNLGEGLLEAYARAKAAVGALDFDDLIARAQRLLGAGEAAAWVLYKLDGAIEHVLIDEGQDTSPAQWALIEPIQSEFFAGLGARGAARTVFAVGDPKQSIYSFQGADPERFLGEAQRLSSKAAAAERRFSAPQLSMSFRSTQTVLDAVDATFADVALAAGDPEASNIVRHRAFRADEGLVEWWPLAQRPARREPRAWDAPLDIESGVTAAGVLARTVAEAAHGWIVAGEAVLDPETGERRAMRAGDILVLVRQRGPVFDEVLRAFKRVGVDVAGADQMRLNEELAVQDLLALMRAAL
ncbi:MAG: UvrD-helicase domain-containing protein, partial [Hyphomonadaceae bacterium]